MNGLTFDRLLIYLDGILCFSRDARSMIENLNLVFHGLRTANLKMHPSKCYFDVKEVLYLGHTYNAQGHGLNQE